MWPVEVIGGESTTYGKLTQKWRTPDRSALIGLRNERTNGRPSDRKAAGDPTKPLSDRRGGSPNAIPFHSIHSVWHMSIVLPRSKGYRIRYRKGAAAACTRKMPLLGTTHEELGAPPTRDPVK